jgi:hypothetical protein
MGKLLLISDRARTADKIAKIVAKSSEMIERLSVKGRVLRARRQIILTTLGREWKLLSRKSFVPHVYLERGQEDVSLQIFVPRHF